MNVRINQAGHQRAVAQVDDFSSRETPHRGPDLDDTITLHEHFAGLHNAPVLYVQQPRRMQHDCMRRLRLGLTGSTRNEAT